MSRKEKDVSNHDVDFEEFSMGEMLIHRYKDKVNKAVEGIRSPTSEDTWHSLKRRCSFDLLDCALDCCSSGKCPPISIDEHEMLVDISLAGYIDERVWYYGEQKVGIDHKDRINIAHRKIEKVINCKKKSSLNPDIFKHDYNLLKFNYHLYQRTIHRKAYWTYLHDRNSCRIRNFDNAKSHVDSKIELYERINSPSAESLRILIELISNNFHISNGLDLFFICQFR